MADAGLRRSEAAVVAITPAAMRDLDRLAALAGRDPRSPVFRRSARQLARIVAEAAVLRQGRWQSSRMLARYTRQEAASQALRYL